MNLHSRTYIYPSISACNVLHESCLMSVFIGSIVYEQRMYTTKRYSICKSYRSTKVNPMKSGICSSCYATVYIYSYSSTAQSICSTLQRWITCALTSFNCSINIQYRFSTATTYLPSRCGSVNLPWRLTFLCFPVSVGCTTTTLWLNYSIENYEFGIMHNVASASSKPIYDCPFYYVNSFINPKAVTDETAC